MARIVTFDERLWDRRGDRLSEYRVADWNGGTGVLLSCPVWIRDQLEQLYGPLCERRNPGDQVAGKFNYGLFFPQGAPDDLEQTLDLLTNVVSIPAPAHVDVAITIDWYTRPNDEDELVHTDAGYWIHTTKHATHPEWGTSRNSRRLMINALANVILTHPLYAQATAIVASPGHLADGQSFGEILAREVAAKVGIPFVETTAPGERPQQKEGSARDLTREFTVQGALSGDVIVLDDVYRTGSSASGAAAAAKRAGADRVHSLTVARTIRR